MRKYKLANEEQARAFVFFQIKEAYRHIGDIIGCLEDVQKVCDSFGIDKRSLVYDWTEFEPLYQLKKRGEFYNLWVEVQDTDGLEDLKTGGG